MLYLVFDFEKVVILTFTLKLYFFLIHCRNASINQFEMFVTKNIDRNDSFAPYFFKLAIRNLSRNRLSLDFSYEIHVHLTMENFIFQTYEKRSYTIFKKYFLY